MSQKRENKGFVCTNCGTEVIAVKDGSYRNHCPNCLYSLHVDIALGDRSNACKGLMAPIGVRFTGQKGWQILHRCENCGEIRLNRVAGGNRQPDSWNALAALSTTT